ncbi:hypothetical protein BX600DRAFT_468161 [Xylariales sp. PMI_506]|nr:hypothetical protein BX600DRAFT_468161 [Xylariales sp. PMI_506]
MTSLFPTAELGPALDPFNSLPIDMPFKSKELLHYFVRVGSGYGAVPLNASTDCISYATHDEAALRDTILIGGLHYLWNTHDKDRFESAILFHKCESIRAVNKGLSCYDWRSAVVCARQICTLCIFEACQGNLDTATAHLNGLIALMTEYSRNRPQSHTLTNRERINRETAGRYLILTSNFLYLMRRRFTDFVTFLKMTESEAAESSAAGKPSRTTLDHMYMWHEIEQRGLEHRLLSLRLLPAFFSPASPNCMLREIDAMAFITPLRDITSASDRAACAPASYASPPVSPPSSVAAAITSQERVWTEGAPARLLYTFARLHLLSLASAKTPPLPALQLPSTWNGITLPVGLYMQFVLGLGESETTPATFALVQYLLFWFRDELGADNAEQMQGETSQDRQDLWFWRTFTAIFAFSLAQKELHDRSHGGPFSSPSSSSSSGAGSFESPGISDSGSSSIDTQEIKEIHAFYNGQVLAWSQATGVGRWRDARARLSRITWPAVMAPHLEEFAEAIWQRIIGNTVGTIQRVRL